MAILNTVRLGHFYFEIAILLRESLFVGSTTMFNAEVWYSVTKVQVKEMWTFLCWGVSFNQRWKKVKKLHQPLFRTPKFTPKVHDSRQIQDYQKCVIHEKFNTKKVKNQRETPRNSVKHQETVWNTSKPCETVTDTDIFGFQLLSKTFEKFLHHL